MPEFLFVNPGNKSQGGHNISTSGRAFVIRKARALRQWSTKSLKSRKKQKGDASLEEVEEVPRLIDEEGVETVNKTAVDRPAPPKSRSAGVVKKRKHGTAAGNADLIKRGVGVEGEKLVSELLPLRLHEKIASDLQLGTAVKASLPVNRQTQRPCFQCGNAQGVCVCHSGATMLTTARQLSGRLDPFGSLAVQMSERDTTLLAYFTTAISPTLTPLPASQSDLTQKYWVTISFSHSGFMHSILCLASLQLAVAQPHQSTVLLERFMYHRLQAIQQIQSALADSNRAISDENIATVFQMLCIEENLFLHAGDGLAAHPGWRYLQPDKAQREAHLDGLKRMLALRGGLEALCEMRGLQAFVIRWVCTSLACRLVFSLPKPKPRLTWGQQQKEDRGGGEMLEYMYKPENKNEWDAVHLEDQTFAASRLLPAGLLGRLYDYPACSPFFWGVSTMVDGCEGVGMNADLVKHVRTVDCLMKDAMSWYFSLGQGSTWDALDLQNLLSIGMGELIRWNLENEGQLSAAENVTAMCLFVFIFLVGNGAHAACSPLPGVMPRMRQHFRDPMLKRTLQAAGIETWVGFLLLIASSQNPASEEYFFRFNIEMLAARSPPVRTFDDYKTTLVAGIWTPVMESHAMKAWEELQGPLEVVVMEGDQTVLRTLTRPRPKDGHVKPSIPMSNPYATSHMKKVFSAEKESILVEVS
ncbi:hypothetical protein QBC43DRAFT_326172 [Cladorrhinum sp. PSN259]|nr:hypothetical protein QBC43DRAFT_326172 [Cladorrhinum sp. PSN259]